MLLDKNHSGFSQLELLVAILLFSSVGVGALQVAYRIYNKMKVAAIMLELESTSDNIAQLLPYFSAHRLEVIWQKQLEEEVVNEVSLGKLAKVTVKNRSCNKVLSFVCSADVSVSLSAHLINKNFKYRIWSYA